MAVCSDFLDPSARNLTLFDRQVTHRDFSNPFDPDARTAVLSAATNLKVTVHDHAIYVNANGPRYETPFEIEVYKTLGADIVGMTAGSEATVLREAEVPYACLAIVTNLAAGISESPLSHEEVVEVMQSTSSKALDILIAAARILVNQRSHHI
jgi:5'-methylthioadenosine phosphorylase